ncbi:testicular acid phosphatase-like [Ornithodoros turicata]|uniref:testicular acid phosphatase-like n=1 Tax=Ornithodoros turicata TaxID=34597 RepID=UPI0031399D43
MARHVGFRTPPESAKAHVDVTSRVEYVFVLSRHGERTPLTQCSKLVKTSPEGYGQLTKTGRKQCKNLGKMLRERYPNLLKGQPGEVRATCNKLPRTFQGVRRTLKGLGFKDVIPAEDATDYDIIEVSALAKNYSSMMEECIGQFKTMGDILDYTVKNTGSPTKPEKAVLQSLDNVITHVHNGHPIPQWASGHWQAMIWAHDRLFEMSLAGAKKRAAAYAMTQLLNTLGKKFEKKRQLPDKMHLFMTSDVVVFSFVRLLCSTYDKRPPFCASFFFEVFLEKNEPRLHLMYYSEAVHASVAMDNLPNPCSVHEFTQELRRILKINK